jgi:hypothetical protein
MESSDTFTARRRTRGRGCKVNSYPKEWDWAKLRPPHKLSEWHKAPAKFGFYEIGYLRANKFNPKYGGRAAGVTLRTRLCNHFTRSHNSNIRRNTKRLWCRYKACSTIELASYVEAVHIAAMDYPWNRRNEWTQHGALEI